LDRLADFAAALSLAFPVPVTSEDALGVRRTFSEQTKAAQAAFQTWLQGGAADGLDSLLGGIPLRSPFGPLRLILKSLTNPPDAAAKSRALLAMVPPGSAFPGARTAAEAELQSPAKRDTKPSTSPM
jgi:hypothetical protein